MSATVNTKTFLNQGIDAETFERFTSMADFSFMSFKKNGMIYRAGEVCKSMFFITKGVTRAYYLYDTKEINLRLVASDNIALQYSSFITQEASLESVQCVTDVEGYMISVKNMASLRIENSSVDYFLRILAENHYLSMERRLFTIQHKTAVERYEYFIENMPEEIINETPAHHIASYLGLTPESLSRMRRQLNK